MAERILRIHAAFSVNYLAAGFLVIGVAIDVGDAGGGAIEAAAEKTVLHLFAQLRWHRLPAMLSELLLLHRIDGQARAGNGELNEEEHEQNDHVLRRESIGLRSKPSRETVISI